LHSKRIWTMATATLPVANASDARRVCFSTYVCVYVCVVCIHPRICVVVVYHTDTDTDTDTHREKERNRHTHRRQARLFFNLQLPRSALRRPPTLVQEKLCLSASQREIRSLSLSLSHTHTLSLSLSSHAAALEHRAATAALAALRFSSQYAATASTTAASPREGFQRPRPSSPP
jgi:hypothetical protein